MEREALLIDLKCKEVHEKQLLLDRKELEARIRLRLKAKLELENQFAEIEMRRLQTKQNDEQFRIEQLQLLAEQDRLDMLTKEKQRIKKQEHYRRVREILTAREDARHAEVFDLVREQNELMALEKRRFVHYIIIITLRFFLMNFINLLSLQARNIHNGTNENITTTC